MDELETQRFIQFMKHQFSKIPATLSAEEYRQKADRYRLLSRKIAGFESTIEKKKYQLLADKCDQLAIQKEESQKPRQAPVAIELIRDDEEKPKTSVKGIKNKIVGSILVLAAIFFITNYPLNFVLTQDINYAIAVIFFILGLMHMFMKGCK